ncbi:DinB family protein [Hyunsoonleella sp. SJ7]|uniref:DinB family protein n=1 Tax=Hyunsoonleella aquatilis TaxID=2762758 RepID=A0A923HI08_9FLAO|nr:DinB family protein [Hyunsoonleella aquatilis]
MNRRKLLALIGISPLAFISSKLPVTETTIVNILIKRWKKSKTYTLAVFEAMPQEAIEYSPNIEQMSFAQHFMHIGFTNNSFIGVLMDKQTYPDFEGLLKADFFIDRPDGVSLFHPDFMKTKGSKAKKGLVKKYLEDTFDYVISSLSKLDDDTLKRGAAKEKPWYLQGHTHLDLVLRAENHTSHHRAQAIGYLRLNGIRPPGYSKHNTL